MEKAIKELVRVLSVPIHVNTGREVDVLNLKVEFSKMCIRDRLYSPPQTAYQR